MAVKIKKNIKQITDLIKRFTRDSQRGSERLIEAAIRKDILRGVSPVKGKRFKKYSDSYRKKIGAGKIQGKSKSPVNMKLTGEMLRSLKAKVRGIRTFRVVITFNDFKADIHNRLGAGKSKVKRRLLPTRSGEEFNDTITDKILRHLSKALDRITRK